MNYDEMLAAAAEAIEMPKVEAPTRKPVVRAGDLPWIFNQQNAKKALKGNVKAGLKSAFDWGESPQGFEFWHDQFCDDELSPEGRAILEQWVETIEACLPGGTGRK